MIKAIDSKIKSAEKKVTKLFNERKAEFGNPDERKYWSANRKLNRARKDIQKLYSLRNRTTGVYVPATPKTYGYTRYETLPTDIQSKIEYVDFFNKRVYYIKNGPMGRNLKDLVKYLEN